MKKGVEEGGIPGRMWCCELDTLNGWVAGYLRESDGDEGESYKPS